MRVPVAVRHVCELLYAFTFSLTMTVTSQWRFAYRWRTNHCILLVDKVTSTAFVEAVPNIRDLISGRSLVWHVSGGTVIIAVAADDQEVIVINDRRPIDLHGHQQQVTNCKASVHITQLISYQPDRDCSSVQLRWVLGTFLNTHKYIIASMYSPKNKGSAVIPKQMCF